MLPLSRLSITKDLKVKISQALAWDDLAGMSLDANKVIEARAQEVQYVREKQVWHMLRRSDAQAKGCVPTQVDFTSEPPYGTCCSPTQSQLCVVGS